MREKRGKLSFEWNANRSLGDELRFWALALFIGLAAGASTSLFRIGISWLQELSYGADETELATTAAQMPWFWLIIIPTFGGLLVGLILHFFSPDGRVRTVAHVIEGAALNNGRIEGRAGLASTAASLITLSTGGSTGREGPAVQLGALISSKIAKLIGADGITGRELLGCAAAAAVSASFNAPIAGAIFALEVILRHYAISAFAPIAISAAAGAVVSRLQFGDVTEYVVVPSQGAFAVELPAFAILGLLCGFVAVGMIKAIFLAEDVGDKVQQMFKIPLVLRPALAGVLLGIIAIFFPQIIGVGYQTTSQALTGGFLFSTALILIAVKIIAVAITLAGRMGGGVFSPSLMVGALVGLTFGLVATSIFPNAAGEPTLYALAGMGAVAAAVLGAPISTTLVVFELTGDWNVGLAVLVSVSLSSLIAARMVHRSFFLSQLARRGVFLSAGPQQYLLHTLEVANIMRPLATINVADRKHLQMLVDEGSYLDISAKLDVAMPMFEGKDGTQLPIVSVESGIVEIVGVLHHLDALKAFNARLTETAREEHS